MRWEASPVWHNIQIRRFPYPTTIIIGDRPPQIHIAVCLWHIIPTPTKGKQFKGSASTKEHRNDYQLTKKADLPYLTVQDENKFPPLQQGPGQAVWWYWTPTKNVRSQARAWQNRRIKPAKLKNTTWTIRKTYPWCDSAAGGPARKLPMYAPPESLAHFRES